ncbi:GNAT family N-acetyltransferase [Parasulfitobacter algicola]|uniref:GNAT family N-acetyltransferase n=1 Tax=Parasulfitobacter algicola TaxID=2614809 RepID=A0ABX2IWY6_9RHOB|nr:GNAT family N-acetyltransferase [Sulfitobacter algicola]NSX56621.1 GNAT family N-acetyltransferase [Sulfitobacter algicola]
MTPRALGPDDLIAWRVFRFQALRDRPDAFLTTLQQEQVRSDDQVRARLAGGALHGAFDGDDLAGALSIDRMEGADFQHRAWINALYVRPQDQGHGLAQRLMDYAMDHARSMGVLQLELYVAAENARAVRFYERLGFAKVGHLPRALYRDGVFEDDLHYVLMLG